MLTLRPGVAVGLRRVFSAALFIQLGIWANHTLTFFLERYLKRRGEGEVPRVALLSLFGFFGQLTVWAVVAMLALQNLGIDVTALVAGLGVGGIAIGLALQNVLRDTFASLSIILDKPFEEGDFIIVGDLVGTVERIGVKTTRLRSLSGEQLVFGNDDLLSSRIRNYKRMYERRVLFSFGVRLSDHARAAGGDRWLGRGDRRGAGEDPLRSCPFQGLRRILARFRGRLLRPGGGLQRLHGHPADRSTCS